jgi:hypothetical protein
MLFSVRESERAEDPSSPARMLDGSSVKKFEGWKTNGELEVCKTFVSRFDSDPALQKFRLCQGKYLALNGNRDAAASGFINLNHTAAAEKVCARGGTGRHSVLKRRRFGVKVQVLLGAPSLEMMVELADTGCL